MSSTCPSPASHSLHPPPPPTSMSHHIPQSPPLIVTTVMQPARSALPQPPARHIVMPHVWASRYLYMLAHLTKVARKISGESRWLKIFRLVSIIIIIVRYTNKVPGRYDHSLMTRSHNIDRNSFMSPSKHLLKVNSLAHGVPPM